MPPKQALATEDQYAKAYCSSVANAQDYFSFLIVNILFIFIRNSLLFYLYL